MTRSILAILFCLSFVTAYSQSSLYIHKDLKQAYENQTRSYDGRLGSAYWQNFAEYIINAEIDPVTKTLYGKSEIVYYNNSPDTLKKIYLKLHQNMNKKGSARHVQLHDKAVTEGVKIYELSYNENTLSTDPADKQISYSDNNLVLNISTPLPPSSKSAIKIEWSFTIPDDPNMRMGAYGDSSFFLAYWYPKVSVYDDINGWDMTSYNGEHEFFNDYADFKVNITVPSDYLVWATGMYKNLDAILTEKYHSRYVSALGSDEVVNIVDAESYKSKDIFINTSGKTTWKFEADYVPDFAFGTSSFYHWDAVGAVAETGRRVYCHAAYNPSSEFFKEAAHISKITVEMLSTDLPGVPFPYPQITVFNGSEGMEFPMIVNDGDFGNRIVDVYVTTHEIAHTYFPFYVGINETRFAWMEEGFAYFLPTEIQLKFEPFDHRIRSAAGYGNFAGKDDDMPLMTPTRYLTGGTIMMINYFKSSVAFEMLQNVLGKEAFRSALQEFIYRWAGKFPTPYDFFHTFNDVTGKDLSWFWKPWFFERGFPDTGIKEVTSVSGKTKVVVEKHGSKPVPVHLVLKLKSGDEIILEETAAIWEKTSFHTFEIDGDVISAEISTNKIPDSNPKNNKWIK